MACNRRVAATPSFPSPTSSLSRPLLEIDLGSLWMLTIGMQTGIGFSSHGPQCSEPLPARLTSLQKLGRFFRMAGKLGMNGQQRRKSGRVERVDVGAVATGENLPVLADPPKSSDETVRPEKDTGRRGHGGRQLHHSISTPALRSKNKQSPQRSAPEEGGAVLLISREPSCLKWARCRFADEDSRPGRCLPPQRHPPVSLAATETETSLTRRQCLPHRNRV